MHTFLKTSLTSALLLAAHSATAGGASPQVPAISTTLGTSSAPGNMQPLPATPPPAGGGFSGTDIPMPTAIRTERLSPKVRQARNRFDSEQRAQIAEYVAKARQAPTSRSTSNIGAQTVYSYRPGAIFTIYTGVGRMTDIALQPGERLTGNVEGSDTERWKVKTTESGASGQMRTHILLKPIDADLNSDILIPTTRRTYILNARSVDAWHMPSVAWTYPMDDWQQQKAAEAKRESVIPVAASPEALRFTYTLKGSRRTRAWAPRQVFDDGKQTFIVMPANLNATDAPTLFIIEDGKPLMVNYRVRGVADGSNGPTYIVDRLFDRAELRVGAKNAITIRRR